MIGNVARLGVDVTKPSNRAYQSLGKPGTLMFHAFSLVASLHLGLQTQFSLIMITVKKLNEKDFYKSLSGLNALDLISFFPEPTYKQKPEYIGLSQEVIFNMYSNIDISVIEMESQSYAEIRFKGSTLGLSFNSSGICTEALLFDDSEEPEGMPLSLLGNKDIYKN